ncbi:hypothetical protein [Novosphingobium sediminicola]|uniref:Uncharacterized protein n=1 Tax=Novosphingobium sediminicola TaxID=563162 RepID=A0A7W6CI69_9SPHN|nr:hypothetical protein [Novosphingobium sediminicola]MBB3955920.1 hypothetical protein [Novosphingobium sediminicola]
MANAPLDSIEWHDLPLASLSISECGVALVVMPWIESTYTYARFVLKITDARSINLDVNGTLSLADFTNLEVSKFEYEICSNGRISGTVGILAGGAGYWEISVASATWSFEAV